MSFIPVNLYLSQGTVRQPDRSNSFQLPPAALTIGFSKVAPDMDPRTWRNDRNVGDLPDDLKLYELRNYMIMRRFV